MGTASVISESGQILTKPVLVLQVGSRTGKRRAFSLLRLHGKPSEILVRAAYVHINNCFWYPNNPLSVSDDA